jgi:uncharacterized protein YggE
VNDMEPKPDTIKITASQREEILASHADLFVTVRGSSVIGGDQALKKAREVSQLVDELTRFGIPAGDIHLQGVHLETASGTLRKSSSAIYRLRVRCNQLEQIGDLIDILATQKNAVLEHIEWKYPDEEAQARALEAALGKAKAKADKVAESLGVRLLGVYDFNENNYDEEAPVQFSMAPRMMKAHMEADVEASLDMDIQHGKTIQVNVEVWYRISGFEDF